MPQFDPSSFASQIFWLVVTFAILYVLMTRVALPRIARVIDERARRIAEDLQHAERLKREADAVVEQYEAAVAKARAEAAGILAMAGQGIAKLTAERQAAFAAELGRTTEAAEARILTVKEQAKRQVRDIAVEIAGDIAQKLAGTRPPDAVLAQRVDAELTRTAR